MTVYGSKAPDKNTLERYAAEGLTQQQMAARWTTESGWNITRSAIAMALEREGVPPVRPRPRHRDLVPWTVKDEHTRKTDVQMLRILARRRAGNHVQPEEDSRLNHWLGRLEEADAVIVYFDDTEEGFFWIKRDEIEEAKAAWPGVPIIDPLAPPGSEAV